MPRTLPASPSASIAPLIATCTASAPQLSPAGWFLAPLPPLGLAPLVACCAVCVGACPSLLWWLRYSMPTPHMSMRHEPIFGAALAASLLCRTHHLPSQPPNVHAMHIPTPFAARHRSRFASWFLPPPLCRRRCALPLPLLLLAWRGVCPFAFAVAPQILAEAPSPWSEQHEPCPVLPSHASRASTSQHEPARASTPLPRHCPRRLASPLPSAASSFAAAAVRFLAAVAAGVLRLLGGARCFCGGVSDAKGQRAVT
jgi:hypothetical protein